MRRVRFWLAVSLGVGAAAGVAAWLLWPSSNLAEYVTAPVERGEIVATVKATGSLAPVKAVDVGTYVSGPILEILADFNSNVTRGQLIAKIDPRTFLLAVDSAEANLTNAQARVAQAKANLELRRAQLRRHQELARTRVVSGEELDVARSGAAQATAELRLAEATVEQARAAVDDARVRLGYTEIVSPIDGIVVSRNVNVGQTVAATFQTPTLFVIAGDLTRMGVAAQVSEADIGAVRDGQTAKFTVDAYPGRPFAATVTQVRNAPQTVQNVVTYDVILSVDNPEGLLKPGMTASVTIVTGRREDVLKVPTSALRFRPPDSQAEDEQHAVATARAARDPRDGVGKEPDDRAPRVYRLVNDQPVPVAVTPGINDELMTEVASHDLRSSDRVILRIKPKAADQPGLLPGFGGPRRRR